MGIGHIGTGGRFRFGLRVPNLSFNSSVWRVATFFLCLLGGGVYRTLRATLFGEVEGDGAVVLLWFVFCGLEVQEIDSSIFDWEERGGGVSSSLERERLLFCTARLGEDRRWCLSRFLFLGCRCGGLRFWRGLERCLWLFEDCW